MSNRQPWWAWRLWGRNPPPPLAPDPSRESAVLSRFNIWWDDAPLPPWRHRCQPWTLFGYLDWDEIKLDVEVFACGWSVHAVLQVGGDGFLVGSADLSPGHPAASAELREEFDRGRWP